MTIQIDKELAKKGLSRSTIQQKACKTSPARFEIIEAFLAGKTATEIAHELGVTRCRVLQQMHLAMGDMANDRPADHKGKRRAVVSNTAEFEACS